MVKNPPARAGDATDMGSIPGSGRSPGGGHGNPLQYSCLENPMDRGAWRAIVHGVSKSQTQLSTHTCTVPFHCMYVPHLLYSFISGRPLRLFHVLAVVNNVPMNTGVHVSFQITVFVSFRYIPRSGIAGSYGGSISIFWEPSILFSTVAAPVYIPIHIVGWFRFLHI